MRRFTSALLFVLATGAVAHAENVDDIIAKNLKARGGLDKLKGIQTLRFTGKMTAGPGLELPFTMEFKRSKRMRFEITFQGNQIVQALDGDIGWTINPMTGKKDPERLAPDELKEAQDQADFDGPLVDYKQKGHKVELVGKQKAEGSDAYKIKITKKNGDIENLFLDADAFLEIKSEGKRSQRGSEVEFESTTGDYKEVNGLMFPFAVEFGAKGQQMGKAKLSISKIEVNPKIDDSRFKMPAASAEKKPTAPPEDKPAPEKKPPVPPTPPKGK